MPYCPSGAGAVNLTGPITSVGAATSIASQTGTGTTFSMSAGPTFTGMVGITAANANVSTDGLLLNNTTVASSGAPANKSPRQHFSATGWKTTATAASQTVDVIVELRTAQGTTAPSGSLVYSYQTAGGGYSDILNIQSDGTLAIGVNGLTACQVFPTASGGANGVGLFGQVTVLQSNNGIVSLFPSTNILAQRSGTAAQESQVYGTYQAGTSSEYFTIKAGASGVSTIIGTQKTGAGASCGLRIQTAGTDAITIDTSQNVTIPTGTILSSATGPGSSTGTVTQVAFGQTAGGTTSGMSFTSQGGICQIISGNCVAILGGQQGLRLCNTYDINWCASSTVYAQNTGADTTFGRRSAANIRFGQADAATAVAQTLSVQNVVAGNGNVAGQPWTFTGCLSNGSGASGDIIFQTGGTGASSGVQNTAVESFRVKGATQAFTMASGKKIVLGNAATTGLTAGVLSATTNSTIVLTDSTGQDYRIPCII